MPCLATTNPAAHAKAASVPHTMPMIIVGRWIFSDAAMASLDRGEKGDFGMADTLGSPAKSIFQSTTLTSSGWKDHGEVAKSHHYLRCYRFNSYALDVPASADYGTGDRGRSDRRRGGGRGRRALACAQSAGWPSGPDARGFRSVSQGDQAALKCGREYYNRRCADDDCRRAGAAGRNFQAGSCLAQHGHDELRPLPDDPALQGQV